MLNTKAWKSQYADPYANNEKTRIKNAIANYEKSKKLNASRIALILLLTYSIFSFSQKNEDMYFVLEDVNPKYAITNIMFDEKIGFINLLNNEI